MSFYDEIAKDIKWDYGSGVDSYLKVVNDTLLLPNPKWLQYHLNYLDKVIEAIHAFRAGKLTGLKYDISKIIKHRVSDPAEGIQFLIQLNNYHEFAVDIETDGLETDKEKNCLLCFGIAYKSDEGVSFGYECFRNPQFKQAFQKFAQREDADFTWHNGIFDKSRMSILEDLDMKIDNDTLLMHYCGINEHKGTHGLKDLAQLYLGFPAWEDILEDWKAQFCRKNKVKVAEFRYSYFPRDMLEEYNVVDCCATFQLKQVFKQLMRPCSINIYKKLCEAAPIYADMIARGMLLDVNYWEQLKNELEMEKSMLEDKMKRLMPGVLVTSPKQLLAWLQKTFPFDRVNGTGKEVIADLLLKYPDNEALTTLLEYRKNVKYLKTYVYALWEHKDYQNAIHCEFKLHGTETGRLSSSNPNMQNIPRNSKIKSLFISRPGYTLLQLDYSQCELRVLAHVSGDETLIQCYVDGRDLHSEMAQRIFGDKFDPHDKDQRMAAKIINFGIPYGRTPAGVAEQLKVDKATAKKYLDDWFKGAPKVKDYIEKCHQMAMAEPQDVYYTVFGRARHYFITSENVNTTKNQSVNFPISSTANDLTIHALVEIGHWLKENKFDAYLVNTVHDSLILEVRPEDAKTIADYCLKVMSEIPKKYLVDTKLPFKADAEIGNCYGALSEPDWGGEEEDE